MKNNLHLAFKTSFNFPLHISIYDSVRAHINDEIRLISMLPGEWPKTRARELLDKNNYKVMNVFNIADHRVEHIALDAISNHREGFLVDGKYFLSSAAMGCAPDIEMLLTPFEEMDVVPMGIREWSWDYLGSIPAHFSLVSPEEAKTSAKALESYYPIVGYEKLGIRTLLDLMAYSYKFVWSFAENKWVAITNRHEITKRIRKPWMQYLTQWRYGESPATEADTNKVLAYLIKLSADKMSDAEKAAFAPFAEREVSLEDISRVAERQSELNKLLQAYHSDHILEFPGDFENDPLFKMTFLIDPEGTL